jgi:hypothetical protein
MIDQELSGYGDGLPLGGEDDDDLRWKAVEAMGSFDPRQTDRIQRPCDSTTMEAAKSWGTRLELAMGSEDGEV